MIGPNTLIKTLEARSVKFRALGPQFDRLQVLYNKGDISRRENKMIEKYIPEILDILKEREECKFLADSIDSIIHGDSEHVLKKFPGNSFDMLAIDPNYGIGFMGKDWDKSVPEIKLFEQCLRVLKPGAVAFFMCSPRQDVLAQMIINLKQAGFEVDFSPIYWTYASGFPKIHNIAKAVDKKNGKTGKVIGIKKNKINFSNASRGDSSFYDAAWQDGNYTDLEVTEPETEQAKALKGAYAGFQPKPAVEVILVVMKPLTEKSYTEQALANGKGCTWLDDCRIPYANENIPTRDLSKQKSSAGGQVPASTGDSWDGHSNGRFPANLIVSDGVLDDGKNHKGGGVGGRAKHGRGEGYGFRPQGNNTPDIPMDEGGYSRFFSLDVWAESNLPYLIVPKASKAEKSAGLNELETRSFNDGKTKITGHLKQWGDSQRKNIHPTVKPIKLMAYLISMGSRPGDLIGDFAAGSGTTGMAAKLLGRKFIGIEKEEEYHRIAVARFENASLDEPVLNRAVAEIKQHEEQRNAHADQPKNNNNTNAVENYDKLILSDEDSATKATLYRGNCVNLMPNHIKSESIDLTVTSPPYDDLRIYKGYTFDFKRTAAELYRVTKKGGVVVWVVGCSTINGSETLTSMQQAIYFSEIGFNLHDTMIFRKINPMPLTHNRYEQEFEYMYVFSKGKPKTFNPILKKCKTFGQKYDYSKRKSASSLDDNGAGRNRDEIVTTAEYKQAGNIWEYAVGINKSTSDKIAFKHPAIFPEKLAADHILSWTNEGDTVFDPMMGSGTTGKMAKLLNRNFIGIEIAEEYFQIAEERIGACPTENLTKIQKPELCFFSNMPQEQLDKLFEDEQEDCQSSFL